MQGIHPKLSKVMQYASIWISLLLHIILLSFLILSVMNQPKPIEDKDKPGLYIPSYAYQEPMPPSSSAAPKITSQLKTESTSPIGIKKPALQSSMVDQKTQSLRAADKSTKKSEDPIHLIGDQKNTPKPLIKLLAKALTANLIYPKMAIDFHLSGVAYVQFIVHPNGQISDIHLLKSSSTSVLDQAAMDAVNAISPLNGVAEYLSQPKSIVFGFIFG